ncbi:uncharacterized protein simc1 isoform X2 [Brachyhypopomus gauderio]|uniref:uncharacterized protein simc1 isoform X2 n=1 Tax=Brachyhypopomus gauderio TaxID=698409 RepID=UPI0040433FE7
MDVISLSSGSEEDSDVEFVGSYKDNTEDATPFIRAELLAVTPVIIDITGHCFGPVKPRHLRRPKRLSSTSEVIDLNDDSSSTHFSNSVAELHRKTPDDSQRKAENRCVESSVSPVTKCSGKRQHSSYTEYLEKDLHFLDSHDVDGGQSPLSVSPVQEKPSTDQHEAILSHLEQTSIQKSVNICLAKQCILKSHASDRSDSESEVPEQSDTFDILDNLSLSPKSSYTERLEHETGAEQVHNTKDTHQKSSSQGDCVELDREHNKKVETSPNWLDRAPSPFSLDSPYYCPSEVDAVIFSGESLTEDDKCQVCMDSGSSVPGLCRANSPPSVAVETVRPHEKDHTHTLCTQAHSQLSPRTLQTSGGVSPVHSLLCGQELPASPTSTEILAGDSPDTLTDSPDLDMESPPSSPSQACSWSSSGSPTHLPFPSHTPLLGSKTSGLVSSEFPPPSQRIRWDVDEEDTNAVVVSNLSQPFAQTTQHVSLVQFKKLKHLIGGGFQDVPADDEEGEDYGPAEPLCRQSLSLVYSTIEENYAEGTVQLLADLIQPRFYPPAKITAHLLKGILLDPQCTRALALEAYNLLMRSHKYHPADISTVPWDWELISSVMAEQVLEDDFQFKLPLRRLNLSIVKAVLSCDDKFRHVRDVISWLFDAAKQSFCYSEDEEMQRMELNHCLKMLLFLQRMLLLAMEVDCRPMYSSNKLSQELCVCLSSTAPSRRLRLLLLNTLESSLLKCKLLELLLNEACFQKRLLPMSFNLLLHFLKTCTLAPDTSDGTERWRRWEELLKLVWMLTLSYEEVMTGHLRHSITERHTLTRPPMWTQNDSVSQAAVQEAANIFLSRVVEDLGHAIPPQIQESLSHLQEHLLSISFN